MGRLLGLPDVEPKSSPNQAPAGGYEFDRFQNYTFEKLAKSMRFVGVFTGIAGAIYGVIALLALMQGHLGGTIVMGVECVVDVVLGLYLVAAANNCRRVVDTQGSDIPNLMGALEELRKYFTLQMVLIVVALVVLGGVAVLYLLAS